MTLAELLTLLRKHLGIMIAVPAACAIAMAVAAYMFMPNTYTASTSMYILMQSSEITSNADLSASQMISNDVATLVNSDRIRKDAASAAGLSSAGELSKNYDISVTSSSTTRVITLSVTGEDPSGAARVANALAESVSGVAQEVMSVQAVNVIDAAQTPLGPSGPRRPLYVAVAAMAGVFAAVAIIVIMDMLNTRVRSAEEVEELLGVPVLGRIPVMKGGK